MCVSPLNDDLEQFFWNLGVLIIACLIESVLKVFFHLKKTVFIAFGYFVLRNMEHKLFKASSNFNLFLTVFLKITLLSCRLLSRSNNFVKWSCQFKNISEITNCLNKGRKFFRWKYSSWKFSPKKNPLFRFLTWLTYLSPILSLSPFLKHSLSLSLL